MTSATPLRTADRYVVIGNPVAHSLSPTIHARFSEQTGEALEYTTLLAPVDGFAQSVGAFFSGGGRGANITLPFKVEALRFADEASARAKHAGAANFLAVRDGRVFADNTDGAGLVTDLRANLGFTLRGARILLLGAGGAARGVIAPLTQAGPSRIVLANRTLAKAQELADHFPGLVACGLESIANAPFDLVVNATSTSTRGEALALPDNLFAPGALAYDMAYGPAARAFVERARALGAARASDGLGMLVEQAAESFQLWRGKRPQTAPVLAELRARA
ncbi:shikimate dehydrogenase [Usitatibacter palustris]|uniref:Shikimate dehydrogenase (NADP(+)) n=1 Tax=Usitatibacter palustris TaxID=2732487 RepID=A0A6M4HFP4_9PROT|nr:shikimate dehydrogenase [Usitatibacter palustris]QJR16867.1 Shikimate dehydrogenase (NADP(+)) [Usitatibacter palustris]